MWKNESSRKSRTSRSALSDKGEQVGCPQVKRSRRHCKAAAAPTAAAGHQCELAIVNLTDTCKDGLASVRLNEKCDDVLREVMKDLGLDVPSYDPADDPLRTLAVPIAEDEANTRTRPDIVFHS